MAKYTNIDKIYDSFDFALPPIKRAFAKTSFFQYLFHEKKQILDWNKKRDLIVFKFFKLKLFNTPRIKEIIHELYFDNFYAIKPILDDIIKEGWKWQVVTVKEFNLIVKFADFVTKFENLDKNKNFSKKQFLLMEQAFLLVVSHEKYPEMIVEIILKVCYAFKEKYFDNNVHAIERAKFRLIEFFNQKEDDDDEGDDEITIYDIIRGVNMAHYRKFLVWNDLLIFRNQNIIRSEFYECSKDTFVQIAMFIRHVLKNTMILEEEHHRIEWLKESSQIDKSNPTVLIEYYEKLKHSWKNDKNDILLVLITVIKALTLDLETIVYKNWEIMNLKEKLITKRVVISDEIEKDLQAIKLEYDFAKTRHSTITPPAISIEVLERWQQDRDSSLDKHFSYIYARIETILFSFKKIAMTLNELVSTDSSNAYSHYNFMVTKPNKWRGGSVYEVINYYSDLLLKLCRFLNEATLVAEIRKQNSIQKQIEQNKKRLEALTNNNRVILEEIQEELNANWGQEHE